MRKLNARRKMMLCFVAALCLLLLAELEVHGSVSAKGALAGFVLTFALVVASKLLGIVLKRPADYYTRREGAEE